MSAAPSTRMKRTPVTAVSGRGLVDLGARPGRRPARDGGGEGGLPPADRADVAAVVWRVPIATAAATPGRL
jgi:hypothetical protein